MGFPVKVPDELYKKVKERAKEQGIPLQTAMLDLLTEPYNKVEELEERMLDIEFEGQEQEESLERLNAEVQKLREQREKDIRVLNSWVSTWKKITGLEQRVTELERWAYQVDERLQALEKDQHRHLFQKEMEMIRAWIRR